MRIRFAAHLLNWAALTLAVAAPVLLVIQVNNGFGQSPWEVAAAITGVAAFGGLVSAGLVYLGYMARSLRSLEVTEQEIGATELVLKQTRVSVVHHRTGRPWRFWEAVGGKLFLTSSRLIFRAHAGQPWRYELVIPLGELARAAPCRIMGLPNGLTVERDDGTQELFGCGVESVQEWASAITVLQTMGPMVEGRGGDGADSPS